MRKNEADYIRIITYVKIEDPKGKEKSILKDIVEVPISFIKDGRLSRTTSWWLKQALRYSNEPDSTVEVKFNW